MRYIPHSEADIRIMLEKIGAKNVDELFEQIPEELRFKGKLDLPESMSEAELMTHLSELAATSNKGIKSSFMGGGAYCHHVPQAVDQILLRSEFYTAYTPYQPEVSQGTTQAIFEFQTMICRLFGMGIANASMYDGATTATEAVLMARRVRRRDKALVSAGVHPEYVEVLRTYLNALDGGESNIEMIPLAADGTTDLGALESHLGDDVAAVLVGYPNFFGVVEPLADVALLAKSAGALTISATSEPFALGVIASPGELGVDIATGEGQSLGVPVSYGGPGLGLFAIRDDKKLLRQMPGRVAGQTVDSNGQTGYVLTLSTREQHIRREKATSNICTNHGLCALSATVNLSLLGKNGFRKVSESCLARGEYLKAAISQMNGFELKYTGATFNEFTVKCQGKKAADVLKSLENQGILGGIDLGRFYPALDDCFMIAVTECHHKESLDDLLTALKNY